MKVSDMANAALESIQEETDRLLGGMGEAGNAARRQLAGFIDGIRPEAEQAIEEGSTITLSLIRDRIAMKTADCFLDLSASERQQIVAFAGVALSTAIKILLV
jgi:hypothetical protein